MLNNFPDVYLHVRATMIQVNQTFLCLSHKGKNYNTLTIQQSTTFQMSNKCCRMGVFMEQLNYSL